jgi:diguanylate cyclase (GGDEF)-like protein
MIDIDSFKAINDGFGHQAGDAVLHAFRTEVQKAVRAGHDLVGRFGGDEFCVVLPGTNAAQAGVIAERLRRHCEANLGQGLARPLPVTISIGIASLAPDRASLVELTADADAALYAAKAGGRNRVVYAGSDGPPCARSSPR